MTSFASALYAGRVIHQRVAPRRHRLSYGVFSLCLDVDEIDRLASDLPLFSRNRFNAISFYDRDHGARDGKPVADHVRELLAAAGLADAGHSISILCYPRIFGYVFNPLSVYFCWKASGPLGAMIYEVNNTFAERKSYVIPVDEESSNYPLVRQTCAKEMYVSPFTQDQGSYRFTVKPPADEVLVAINFRDLSGPILNARFSGKREALTNRALAAALVRFPLMTLKVIGGIHLEAARLWRKGVPIVAHQSSPPYSYTVVGSNPPSSIRQTVDA